MAKTKIMCEVSNCMFHKNNECHANTVSIRCDNCIQATSCHETACESFCSKSK